MAETGKLVILSGPSGVGKDTVLDAWMKRNPRVERVVAYTTRAPRPGEVGGVDYHYVSETEFVRLASEGAFVEYKNVHDNFYATPLADMESMLAEGKIAVLKIDVQGALEVMKLRSDATTVFILPPSEAELERRIVERGTDDPASIQRRLENARREIELSTHYQHKILNDSVANAVEQLQSLVCGD